MPNVADPVSFVEKCRAWYLRHPNPLMSLAADKIASRAFAKTWGATTPMPEILAVLEADQDITAAQVPDTCVIKTTDGCGANMEIPPGTAASARQVRQFRRRWVGFEHWRKHAELHYRDIPQRVFAEEYLSAD